MRAFLGRAGLLLGALLVALCLLEVALRVRASLREEAIGDLASLDAARAAPDRAKLRTRDIIRMSHNPRIVYELIPGLSGTYRDAALHVNSQGFRGREVAREKHAHTVRIVGVGDSVMFGWGVEEDELYLARLAARLAERRPEIRFEVVNSAVPGYNTPIEVEVLADRLLAFHPDLVVVGWIPNDVEPPNFVRVPRGYLRLDTSFLLLELRALRQGLRRSPDGRLAAAPRDPAEIPPEYRAMRGLPAVEAALARLAELGVLHGFRSVIVAYPHAPAEVRATAARLGIGYVEVGPAFDRWLAEHGVELEQSPLVRSADDPHPSALGHELFAETLLSYLDESGTTAALIRGTTLQDVAAPHEQSLVDDPGDRSRHEGG
jgi:lysophospholipase L1-like esterase